MIICIDYVSVLCTCVPASSFQLPPSNSLPSDESKVVRVRHLFDLKARTNFANLNLYICRIFAFSPFRVGVNKSRYLDANRDTS